ncbi:hypothetical protein J6590_031541 [Homalodisca vitripennis]|nr:hypothetical protein J6590_031541 [Homalodisca vitripennis]
MFQSYLFLLQLSCLDVQEDKWIYSTCDRYESWVGTHITAPRPTRESADCWPSHGETIAAQYLTCKFRHVRTDTRPSWPHRGRTVTDSSGLNFDGHAASAMDVEKLIEEIRKFPVVYDQSNDKYRNTEYKEKVWKKIADNLELGEGNYKFKKSWSHLRSSL